MTDVKQVIKNNAAMAEAILTKYLSPERIGEGRLQDAMRYSTLGGGKRIRACLALEFCRLFSKDTEKAEPYAAAIEMIHAFSLIHDDMPCMDDDDMRRGKPSCHVAFDEATALLAGDTLLAYAMQVASGAEGVSDFAARRATEALAYNSGPFGMAGGQMIDLENSADTLETLWRLHSMKTSALIKAACLAGYYSTLEGSADPSVESAISEYAESIGLAFQIKDDLLDIEGDAATLGKRVGIDEKNGRVNSLTFLTPDEARAECERLAKRADDALARYGGSEFLRVLPYYLNSRKN